MLHNTFYLFGFTIYRRQCRLGRVLAHPGKFLKAAAPLLLGNGYVCSQLFKFDGVSACWKGKSRPVIHYIYLGQRTVVPPSTTINLLCVVCFSERGVGTWVCSRPHVACNKCQSKREVVVSIQFLSPATFARGDCCVLFRFPRRIILILAS